MAKVKPLGDRVIVKRLDAEEVTKGGIILPDSAKEKPREGRVIAVGDGRVLEDGKRADVVISKGDLLETTTQVTDVWIDGVRQDIGNRQTRLYERYHERLHAMEGK